MNELSVLRRIRDANYHLDGIRCRRLFRVENAFLASLAADTLILCRSERPSDVGLPGHITHWTRPHGEVLQFSLLNASGRYDDFSTDHNFSCFGKRFRDGPRYPSLALLVNELPHLVNFRINVLGPGAGLAPHEEHVLFRSQAGAIAIRARFHLPIVTNTAAELTLDGDVYHLEAGAVYFVNHGCVHDATNRGERPRVHLVWDMLLTREAYDAMFEGALLPRMPLRPVAALEEQPRPLRRERMDPHNRLPDPVPRREADLVTFCEAQ